MRVLISAEGDHDPPHHLIVVDDHAVLVDLTGVTGTLHDPTIARVEWGPLLIGEAECGRITRKLGPPQAFADKTLLKPYLDAFAARTAQIAAGQAAFDAAKSLNSSPD